MRSALIFLSLLLLAGCHVLTDPATSLAYAIEAGASHLPSTDGARCTIRYEPPGSVAADGGSYAVQFDKVGALIVWYKDAGGKVVDSGSTSFLARFVDTPRTYKIDKPGDAPLLIDLEREHGRAVIVGVR